MFSRILEVFLPIFVIVLVGYVYGRRAKPDFSEPTRIALAISLPALSFSALATMPVSLADDGALMLAGAIVMLGGGAIGWLLSGMVGVGRRAFITVMAFGNAGQVGLPLASLAFGPEGLKTGVLLMIAANLLHFTLGVTLMSGRPNFRALITNSTILASLGGLAFAQAGASLPAWCMVSIRTLGDMLIPVMLLSMGARMTSIPWASYRIGIIGGLASPLARLVPALACAALLPLTPVQRGAIILFGALPSAIFNYMLADRYRREADAVAAMVMIGHLLAIVLLPAALYLSLRASLAP